MVYVRGPLLGPLQKAKEYAFLILAVRPRSREELRQRLARKKFDSSIIAATLDFLQEKKFLDDAGFARQWISYRLTKPYGVRRIRQELQLKGVASGIIEDCIAQSTAGYSERAQVEVLVKNKVAHSKGVEPLKAKRRLYAYFVRRGFSPEVVIEELNKFFKE